MKKQLLLSEIDDKDEWKQSGVYLIYCRTNKQVYIGSSKNLLRRLKQHRASLRKGLHKNWKLRKDFRIYGENAFVVMIHSFCKNYLQVEQDLIDFTPNTYNIQPKV